MKDVLTILKKVEKIKEKVQNASIILETSAPVCSKSIKFLKENGVDILKMSEDNLKYFRWTLGSKFHNIDFY